NADDVRPRASGTISFLSHVRFSAKLCATTILCVSAVFCVGACVGTNVRQAAYPSVGFLCLRRLGASGGSNSERKYPLQLRGDSADCADPYLVRARVLARAVYPIAAS